jgi:sulfide:quinone oxidoreductase
MRVVIVGGSFGGLTAAYELRKLLTPDQCEITVISKDPQFVFIPSLPWVAIGSRTLDQISFPLGPALARRDIDFIHAAVEGIDPLRQIVETRTGGHQYDYVIIATGHRSANETVPGLGPFEGPGHSLMSPVESEETHRALLGLLRDPGPIVVGCAQGASCIGPAYEFAFGLDHLLRQRRLRHQVPMVFVTPEPFLGHLGVGGAGKARQFLEGEFDARDIHYVTSSELSEISESAVTLVDGRSFDSRFSMVIPPLAGVSAVATSPGLANPKGFVSVDDDYRHDTQRNVFAVGVAVAMPPVEHTPVPVNFPKTGHMTEQMARVAASAIAADLGVGEARRHPLTAECILDMGDRAVRIKIDPVRPPRNVSLLSEGRHWLWAKRAFERYYLWRAKRGKTGAGWGW